MRTIQLDDAAGRPDRRFLQPIEVRPTRVPSPNRWLAPAVGLMVAIVSFGFGSSLASAPSTDGTRERTGVAADVPAIQWNGRSPRSIVVRGSSRGEIALLRVSILSEPCALQIDGLVGGAATSVLIHVADREGNVMATSIADTHALPSVLVSDPTGIGLSGISALLPLSTCAALDEVWVDLEAA